MKRALLLALALTGHALPASAADNEELEALIKKGVELRRAGKDEDALVVFKDAFIRFKAAKAEAQLGLAEQALGRWVEAEAHLLDALATPDPWIEQRREPLLGAVEDVKSHLGSLELIGGQDGARVRLNGELAGVFPLSKPLRAVAGTIALEVTLDGHHPISRSVNVPQGGLARETVKLAPLETAAVSKPPPPPSTSAPSAGASTSPADEGPPYDVLAIASLGVGVAGLATGVIGLVMRNGHVSKWNSDDCIPNNGTTREQNCADEKSGAETGGTIATVGFIAGGVGLAASAVFWFVLRPDETAPVASMLVDEHGTIGLALSGRF